MGFLFDFNYCCKKSRDYGPRGKSLLYYIPHIPDIPHIPNIPEIFDLGISSQTGFFLGGVFGTIFLGGVFGTFLRILGFCHRLILACFPCHFDDLNGFLLSWRAFFFFLWARTPIPYTTCRLRNILPNLQIYTKKVLSSMEIERQIAKDSNTLNTFQKKWSRLKSTPQELNSSL